MARNLTPVSFTHVSLSDQFWAPRIAVNRATTLPREYELCETTGRIAALDLGWQPGQGDPPHIFWDSDIAKWIEAASYALATHPDPQLDALVDQVIAKIAVAQGDDGYLNTHYQVLEKHDRGRRFTNLRDNHELYCAGHMIEAAVAHYQATGKHSLLQVARRYADYIDQMFGREPDQMRGYDGHEEIELALVKLYHATTEPRYLKLAQYFVDERGQQPHFFDREARKRGDDPAAFRFGSYEYNQSHQPVREQSTVTGHAVRAMYLYAAMADLATETGDPSLLAACRRLWHSIVDERMYLTGGIGPAASNEGFTDAYDLPDETAYAETCAAVGMIFWNHRMLQFAGDRSYADVMERALYNGAISGVSLDGTTFFYENPLASRGAHHRQPWFDVACCPPNIARLIASVGGYFYSTSDAAAWVHLYGSGEGKLAIGSDQVVLRQTTAYPWDGSIAIAIETEQTRSWTLNLRIPGWCREWDVAVNGERIENAGITDGGYLAISREWRNEDCVSLDLAMPIERVRANPDVRQMIGRAALQRGPIVYCLEGVDHPIVPLDRIALPSDHTQLTPEHRPDLLGGVTVLRGDALALDDRSWDGKLYSAEAPQYTPIAITAVPYCVWDNRDGGEMRVWLREV